MTLVAGAAGVWAVGFSTLLGLTSVEVSGTNVATAAQVREAVALAPGTSLVRIDTAAVAERVAGLPAVATVGVRREWPTRLRVEVTEREPRLAVASGTGFLIADATGVVFDSAMQQPRGLVLVAGDPDEQELLADAGLVFSALPEPRAEQVRRIEVAGSESITIRFRDGSRVFWGSAADSGLKAEVFEALVALGGTTFDVSAPSHPARR